jgi:PAS domain S-box-containing protein
MRRPSRGAAKTGKAPHRRAPRRQPNPQKTADELRRELAEAHEQQAAISEVLKEAQRLAHVGYWERDLASNILTWSDETFQIFGLSPRSGGVTLAQFEELIHPEDHQRIVASGAEALRRGANYSAEYQVVRPNGEVRIIRSRGIVKRDESGRACRMFGIVQDMTERKLVEMALRERAQLLDLTHDTIFVRNMSDVISFWNDGAEKLYGWKREEAVGQVTHQLLRTILPARLEEINAELLRTGRWDGELVHTKRDGSQVAVASRWALQRDEQGNPTAILETNNDITERKRAEYLTEHVFDSSPDSMAIVGRDYRFKRVNPVHEWFWEQPAGSEVGKLTAEIMGQEFFEQKGKPNLDRCFAGEEVRYADWFATPRGRKYRMMTVSPLRPDSQQVEAALVIARDLTDHMQASEALRDAQTELAHVNRVTTMGQLAASIAHEVSQPVAAVVANADAALRWLTVQPPDLEEVRQALADIIKDGNRAGEVIERIRAALIKKAPLRNDQLDINQTILDVIALTRSEMLRNGVSLHTQLTKGLPLVQGDRIQLQQVMLNLIVNAIEATSGSSEQARELLISTEKDATNAVLVAVRDSGPGLDAEGQSHLFDAFYTTKPGGMGMGLSICRSIIEAHGGRIWATANTPRGANFQFALYPSDTS